MKDKNLLFHRRGVYLLLMIRAFDQQAEFSVNSTNGKAQIGNQSGHGMIFDFEGRIANLQNKSLVKPEAEAEHFEAYIIRKLRDHGFNLIPQ